MPHLLHHSCSPDAVTPRLLEELLLNVVIHVCHSDFFLINYYLLYNQLEGSKGFWGFGVLGFWKKR